MSNRITCGSLTPKLHAHPVTTDQQVFWPLLQLSPITAGVILIYQWKFVMEMILMVCYCFSSLSFFKSSSLLSHLSSTYWTFLNHISLAQLFYRFSLNLPQIWDDRQCFVPNSKKKSKLFFIESIEVSRVTVQIDFTLFCSIFMKQQRYFFSSNNLNIHGCVSI